MDNSCFGFVDPVWHQAGQVLRSLSEATPCYETVNFFGRVSTSERSDLRSSNEWCLGLPTGCDPAPASTWSDVVAPT
eukprot:6186740-Karenia_brevis.AAC.1